ncbi:MAG: hypothetical protein K2K73_00760, partial [Ureaplasma sp.]|nr:hypothetical protein [Ureaplasma sp.]
FNELAYLFNAVQDYIDNIKFTSNEFSEYVNSNNNLEALKTLISSNLSVSNSQKIDDNKIQNISFANGNLVVFLDSNYNIYSADNYQNVILTDNILTIKNLKYFSIVDLVKLDELFSSIQTFIDNNKYTIIEFNDYITNNLDLFKNLISDNLFVTEQNKILVSEIIDISLDNNQNLKISLNDNYIKYNLEENINFEMEGTNLIVKNLNYYQEITFNNLDNLFNAIQNEIKNNKYTIDEFNNYLTTNVDSFKKLISDNLYILDSVTLEVDKIEDVNFNLNTNELNIVLNSNYLKYVIANNDNINLNNTTLTISNLRYYDMFEFININELFNKIQEFITTNKFTPEEFKDFANVTDNNAIKTLISNNLLISSTETLPIKDIIDVTVNDNYDLEVSLNKDYVKYDM